MRLIDADKIMADIATAERSTSKDYCLLTIARYIRTQPTIDAEPVRHGKWLFEEYPDGYYHSKCSLCNSWFSEDAFLNPYKYCPNCGACMIKQGDITTKRLDIPTMDEVNDETN